MTIILKATFMLLAVLSVRGLVHIFKMERPTVVILLAVVAGSMSSLFANAFLAGM